MPKIKPFCQIASCKIKWKNYIFFAEKLAHLVAFSLGKTLPAILPKNYNTTADL